MIEGVPRRDLAVLNRNHATKKRPLWARINARTRRPCCRRRSLRISVMLTNKEAGRAKDSASLLSPADWSASKALPLPPRYPSASTKKTGSSAPTSPLMFMENSSSSRLELHLCSESENYGGLRSSSHLRVVLNDRLKKEHRQGVQQRVEFNAVLRLPGRCARRKKLLAEAVLHVAERHGVVKAKRQRLVETQPRS